MVDNKDRVIIAKDKETRTKFSVSDDTNIDDDYVEFDGSIRDVDLLLGGPMGGMLDYVELSLVVDCNEEESKVIIDDIKDIVKDDDDYKFNMIIIKDSIMLSGAFKLNELHTLLRHDDEKVVMSLISDGMVREGGRV